MPMQKYATRLTGANFFDMKLTGGTLGKVGKEHVTQVAINPLRIDQTQTLVDHFPDKINAECKPMMLLVCFVAAFRLQLWHTGKAFQSLKLLPLEDSLMVKAAFWRLFWDSDSTYGAVDMLQSKASSFA